MALFDKPLFIFEMANNHQGSVEHGKRIIREVADGPSGFREAFDFAFKFQYRDLDTFIHPAFRDRMDVKNVRRFQETRLSPEQFLALKEEAAAHGMFTICTAFDERSVDRIAEQRYDALKIASCSFTDWPLLEKAALCGLPIIASAAGSSAADIDRVVEFFRHRGIDLSLMHCVAEYPTPDGHQEMNQIDFYRQRYPHLRIGFSTHEPPGHLTPILAAVAKGAVIFEKHVGVPTEEITLNDYSANPEQVRQWLSAALDAFGLCGVSGQRYTPREKERADLLALQRGVFARDNIAPGAEIGPDDIYLAFPSQSGQVLASHLSKYTTLSAGEGGVEKDAPLMVHQVSLTDRTGQVRGIVDRIIRLLRESSAVIPADSTCEISHHYGLNRYAETGVAMINCINREYCKKLLIVLPGQSHPVHYHRKKEETFLVLYGTLDLICDGKRIHAEKGDKVVIERGMNHAFRSETGCVFEEISTTHYPDDSFYESGAEFANPRKTTVYLTQEMLDTL